MILKGWTCVIVLDFPLWPWRVVMRSPSDSCSHLLIFLLKFNVNVFCAHTNYVTKDPFQAIKFPKTVSTRSTHVPGTTWIMGTSTKRCHL